MYPLPLSRKGQTKLSAATAVAARADHVILEASQQIIAGLKSGDDMRADRETKRGSTGHLVQPIIADILNRRFLNRLGHGFYLCLSERQSLHTVRACRFRSLRTVPRVTLWHGRFRRRRGRAIGYLIGWAFSDVIGRLPATNTRDELHYISCLVLPRVAYAG